MADWRAPNLEALCGSFLIISGVTVGMRFYSRRKLQATVGLDDWFMLLALLTFIGSCVVIFIGIHFQNFGYSSHAIDPAYAAKHLKLGENLLNSVFFISYANLAFVKLSAIFFYRRLFDVPGTSTLLLRICLWTSIVVVILWLVAFELLFGLQCGSHYSALWISVAEHEKYCLYTYPDLEGAVITDVILDVWVILLPLPWVFLYVLSKTRRLAVCGLFLLSLIGLAASIARMVVAIELIELGPVKAQQADPRRIDSRLFFYFILESGMAILAINLPVISLTVIRLMPNVVQKIESFSHSLTSFATRSFRSSRRGSPHDAERMSSKDVIVTRDIMQSREKTTFNHSIDTEIRGNAHSDSSIV